MREFDITGLHLAEAQGNIFVESLSKYTGSSPIFIKRFMYSKEAINIDKYNTFDSAKILSELEKKSLSYGTNKYDEDIIYWIGYIYRYFAYVYEISSKKVYQIVNADEMNKLYKVYHTMDPKFAIDRILEEKNINLNKSLDYQYQLYKRVIMQEDISKEYTKTKKRTIPMVEDNDAFYEYVHQRDKKPIYTIYEIKKTLKPIFEKYKVKKAILFGSYVKGTADTRSDIDLVVETNLSGLNFYGLLGEVSDKLRFPVDLIDRKEIKKNSKLEKEVKETGVVIYGE